jgi:hypothetical protein
MRRREPPPLAAWVLRHLTTGDRDEALDGDLLEVFRLGRSSAWYWRQVITACSVSWMRSLRERSSLLVFALIWAGLAPAWTTIVDRIQTNSHQFGHVWKLSWPFSILAEFTSWMGLDVVFLWAGILLYVLVQPRAIKSVPRTLARAFVLAPLFLLPAYFATFVLMNLFVYPGLAIDVHTITPVSEITDLRLWANAVRMPFLIALVGALWSAVPVKRRIAGQLIEPASFENSDQHGSVGVASRLDEYVLRRTFSITVGAGLVNAMIAAVILCRLPDVQPRDLGSVCGIAASYVLVGALAGVVGSWLYWNSPTSPLRDESPLPFSLFALTCAAGWVWVPAMVLFAEQVSAATALAAMLGAMMLAPGLRRATTLVFVPAQSQLPEWDDGELFAESLYQPPFDLRGYVIALGLAAAGAAIFSHSNYTAAALLATSAFLFAWEQSATAPISRDRERQVKRAAMRVLCAALPAVLLTMWALLDGMSARAHRSQMNAAAAAAASASDDASRTKNAASSSGIGGYQSVVLWPFPPKKQIAPPLQLDDSLLASGSKKPYTIRFNGAYWFLQSPLKQPGRNAHVARGTPVNVDIKANNATALVMDAHQKLPASIRTARCREVQVEIENLDNRAGIVALAVFLTDDQASPKQTFYLGQQPVVSTEPGRFYVKLTPVTETLRFAVPPNASLRKFNEITVMFLPDYEHTFVAPKIAIVQFDLLPR